MDEWGDLEIVLEHLKNGTLRILVRDCPELDDEEMIAFIMIKFTKVFLTSFPEKQGHLKKLLDVMFKQEQELLN